MKLFPFQLVRCCPHCKSLEIHHSQRQGWFERFFLRLFFMRPFRCNRCLRRHYNFSFSKRLPARARGESDDLT